MYFFSLILVGLFPVFALAEPEVKSLNFSFDDFTVIEDNKTEKPKPEAKKITEQKEESKGKTAATEKNQLEDFFDKSLKIFDNLRKKGGEVIESIVLPKQDDSVKVKKPEDPAKKFPDPFFYDATYNKRNKFITYAYVYNDKTNRENDHIPTLKNYNIYSELFLLSKSGINQDKFYNLFYAVRYDTAFDINRKDQFGNTLLLTTLRNGNLKVFYFLLNQGANPNICNDKNICPLYMALYSGKLEIIEALLNKNVDIRVIDKNDLSPIKYAIYENKEELFDAMLKRYLRYIKNDEERKDILNFAKTLESDIFIKKLQIAFRMK